MNKRAFPPFCSGKRGDNLYKLFRNCLRKPRSDVGGCFFFFSGGFPLHESVEQRGTEDGSGRPATLTARPLKRVDHSHARPSAVVSLPLSY